MAKICIVPDVHGRTFWKAAKTFDGPVVFLGDYFDPYAGEKGVDTHIDALLKNFQEIRDFRDSRDNVTLLKGNHDFHYLTGLSICTRYDAANAADIFMALRNANLQFATDIDNVLFSHAALSKRWVGDYDWIETAQNAAVFINNQLNEHFDEIAFSRGGYHPVGSPIWQDPDEIYGADQFPFQQVCGHMQLRKTGDILKWGNITCIDSRSCFVLDTETREITPYK